MEGVSHTASHNSKEGAEGSMRAEGVENVVPKSVARFNKHASYQIFVKLWTA